MRFGRISIFSLTSAAVCRNSIESLQAKRLGVKLPHLLNRVGVITLENRHWPRQLSVS